MPVMDRPRGGPERRRGAARAPWGSISREQIIAAATKVIRARGYEQLTMRSLAAELGVGPMSLYGHVRDKDDLLDEVVERLMARAWKPRVDEADWKAWVAEAADKLRQFLVNQPAALHVYLRHPVVAPSAVVRMGVMVRILRNGLGSDDAAGRAYAALHTYTVGFAALEASRSRWDPALGQANELSRQLAAYTTPHQFAEGLGYLLDGIERDAPS